jgi:hypothetical protein
MSNDHFNALRSIKGSATQRMAVPLFHGSIVLEKILERHPLSTDPSNWWNRGTVEPGEGVHPCSKHRAITLHTIKNSGAQSVSEVTR